MKKLFTFKRVLWISFVLLILIAVTASTVVGLDVIDKKGNNNDKKAETSKEAHDLEYYIENGFEDYTAGYYCDNSRGKKTERIFNDGKREIKLKYKNTYNSKGVAVTKRDDIYVYIATDTYVDDEGSEYEFLYNTDLYCGFRKSKSLETETANKVISKEAALKSAESYMKSIRDNYSDYVLYDFESSELVNNVYEFKFYLPVCGFRSDDIFTITIKCDGTVESFYEKNYKRYDNVKITPEEYKKADLIIEEDIKSVSQSRKVSSLYSYISINDSGELVLVRMVKYAIVFPNSNMRTEYLDTIECKIK